MDKAFYIYVDSANRESGSIADFNFATTQNRYVSSRAKVGLESIQIPYAVHNVTSANNELAFLCTCRSRQPRFIQCLTRNWTCKLSMKSSVTFEQR
jgi:hypothetical protein